MIQNLFIASILFTTCSAEIEKQLPLGLEGATGLRSNYIYRGEKLAELTLDFQLHGLLSYSETKHLEYGIWNAGEQNSGTFSEFGALMNFTEERGSWNYSAGFKYKNISNSPIQSGFELDLSTRYNFNKDHNINFEVSYDTGVSGWYSSLYYQAYQNLSEKSYFSLKIGTSFTNSYYSDDGFNDLFTRFTYTYNLTENVSLSPFIEGSIRRNRNNLGAVGVWFATSF